jgi:hypothetical protein
MLARRSSSQDLHPTRDTRGTRKERPALRTIPTPILKSRYRIRKEGGDRILACVEAPTIAVRLETGLTATAQEARNAPAGTIFLDGAAQCAPFADPARRVYNLDHHEGCVRAFTLSACEQAMVMVRKGLELQSHEWTVRANDADLDAVLAIWVLLNHLRLNDPNDPIRTEIMPLLRLEGAIDAQGLDLQDLCALPPALLDETRRRMDRLRDHERNLKSGSGWQRIDQLEYLCERLTQIDQIVYPSSIFDGLVDIEELGRTELGDGSIALACRARIGIYEAERELRRLHGPRLGLIVLKQRKGVYTLRQVNPSLAIGLDTVYEHLNLVDPNADSPRRGNRWGGSEEIGGSPRQSGSRLSTPRVLDVCRHAFAPPSVGRRLVGLARAVATTSVVLFGALVVTAVSNTLFDTPPPTTFGYALGSLATLAFLFGAARSRCLFGLRLPQGTSWIQAIPFAVAGALLGGSGLAARSVGEANPLLDLEAALPWLAAIVGTELLFRGLVQGQLVWAFGLTSPARADRRVGLGTCLNPVVLAALLSSAIGMALANPGTPLLPLPQDITPTPLVLAGSLIVGLAAGLARTRSRSVFGAIAAYGVAAVVLAFGALPGLL